MSHHFDQESPASSDWQDMLDLLGDEKTYTEVLGAGLERETLLISRIDKDAVIVEHLEPGGVHNVFKVTAGGTTAEKKQLNFASGSDSHEQAPSETLDEVLKKFGVK